MTTPKTQDEWGALATHLIKAEFARKGLKHKDVIQMLKAIGVNETYQSFTGKLNRQRFTFVFALQCLKAIGVKNLRIDDDGP